MPIVISNNFVLPGTPALNANNPVVGWRNIVSVANVAADTADAAFPALNLANPATHLFWRAANTNDQAITVGVSQVDPIDYIAVAGHNFGSGIVPVSVHGRTNAPDSAQKVLLHFDGPDGSTTLTDSNTGGAAHTWTANGNAQIDTAQFQFGGGSGLFDGTGDFWSTPDHADFTLGSGAFTIDLWMRPAVNGSLLYACGQLDAAGAANANSAWYIARTAANKIEFGVVQGTTVTTVVSTTSVLAGAFAHIAAVRTGNTLKLFLNGVQEGGDVSYTGSINDSSAVLAVGRAGAFASNEWNGWIDEGGLYNVARWTSDFTPPLAPAPWFQLVQQTIPADDSPLLFRFVPQSLTGVMLALAPGAVLPQAAVVYVGKLLVLQRRLYVGHRVLPFNRSANIVTGASEEGQFLGRIVLSEMTQSELSLTNMTPAFYRSDVEPWLRSAVQNPFFFAWRPSDHPMEVGYCWSAGDAQMSNQRSNGMVQASLTLRGIVK